MKENSSNESAISPVNDSIREKITLLTNIGFIWKEIATLTDIPKKMIKELAKGKHIVLKGNLTLKEEDYKWLETQIEETIKRLRSCIEALGIEKNPEVNSEAKADMAYILDVQKLSFYINKAIDDVVVKIEGVKFYETPAPISRSI